MTTYVGTATRIADIIVPSVFNPYVIQRTAELSAFSQSGIITNNPELDRLAIAGGKFINMPYFNDLVGDDEVLDDTNGHALTPAVISAGQDIAALLMRGKAWAVNDLAKAISGDDPMKAIGDLVAAYWARKRQAVLFSALQGAMGVSSMSGNVADISAGVGALGVISASTFVDALQVLGDAKYKITAVVMHSAVEAKLQKDDLIITLPATDLRPEIKTFVGRQVIVDDGCPYANGVATTYIFGQGAFGLGNGGAPVPTETDRDSLAGDDVLINRQHYVLHPRGIKFVGGTVAGSSPTNAELATTSNWARVYDNKNIRIIKFIHKLA